MSNIPPPPSTQNFTPISGARKYIEYCALATLLITFFAFYAVKVWDIDFWWHIAAGKYILETAAIPSVDPFGVYDAANVWGQTVLKSQWLGQVLMYSVYRWFDLNGIIFFRAGVLTLCLAIVYLRCRLAATTSLFSLLMTVLAGLAILQHTGERPQLFSFLYLSVIFLLLDTFLQNGNKRWVLYCIPLLMLLWVNTHGGAVLGLVALTVFGTCYILECRMSAGYFNTPQVKVMLGIIILSVAAWALSPNGFNTFQFLLSFENSPLRGRVSEYASPWSLWPTTLYYWVFAGVALVALPSFFNQAYFKQGCVVIAIGIISLTGYRYIPLFVLLTAPYVAASLGRMFSGLRSTRIAPLLVLVMSLAILGYGFSQGRVFQQGAQEQKLPTGAVAFIKTHNLSGKIFNTMNWGGYLIWQLPDTLTPFIDGRMLDPARAIPYTHILWTTPDGQRFFEQANFDLALIPYANAFTGERYPVINYLLNHPAWQVAYQDKAGYLFVRRGKPSA